MGNTQPNENDSLSLQDEMMIGKGDLFCVEPQNIPQSTLHRSIVALVYPFPNSMQFMYGSGALLSKDTILTAAHNLIDKTNKRVYDKANFRIYLSTNQQRYYEVDDWRYPSNFIPNTKGNIQFDYALIKLKDTPVQYNSFLQLSLPCKCIIDKDPQIALDIYGYPHYKSNHTPLDRQGLKIRLDQYGLTKNNAIEYASLKDFQIKYTISTQYGHSGSPVTTSNKIIAIHKASQKANQCNVGRLVTIDLIADVQKWQKELKCDTIRINSTQNCSHIQSRQIDYFTYHLIVLHIQSIIEVIQCLYYKTPMITVEVGTFEELFVQNTYSNIREQRQKKQYKEKHKQLIESVMYTIDIIRKYQSFDFANSYQLCNQMEKSYKYIMGQIQQLVQNNSTDQNGKLQLLYSQENYYSRLSDICRKMGRLSQALMYQKLAIQKCKQLEKIDKNRSFHYYQQKLNAIYLESSQILIEQHQYSNATNIINERIEHLKSNKDQKQRQRNKVIISRLLLDLGVANFKQGKIDEAKQIFTQSANNVEEIFTFINYDYLNEETFFVDWIIRLLFIEDLKWNEGRDVFYERERKKKIQQITYVYGGQESLQEIQKKANSFAVLTTQLIQNNREHIINEMTNKLRQIISNANQIAVINDNKKLNEQRYRKE